MCINRRFLDTYTRRWYFCKNSLCVQKYTIILGDHLDQFVQDEIKSGRYASVSEIIRAGLRLLQVQNEKIKAINKALVVGEESGSPVPFDNKQFKKRMRDKHMNNA